MEIKKITLPLKKDDIDTLKPNDAVLLTGEIITGRDAAHKKLFELKEQGIKFPVDLSGETIFYAGPCPAYEDMVVSSCGPTTSARVDKFTPMMLDCGIIGIVGKGKRSKEVIEKIKEKKAVYFVAIGGAGALYGNCIKESKVIAFPELQTEAIHRFYVEDFPVIVAIDKNGNSIF